VLNILCSFNGVEIKVNTLKEKFNTHLFLSERDLQLQNYNAVDYIEISDEKSSNPIQSVSNDMTQV
jgi:hypothetical protein